LAYIFESYTNADKAYLDAFTTIFSFLATYLEAKKNLICLDLLDCNKRCYHCIVFKQRLRCLCGFKCRVFCHVFCGLLPMEASHNIVIIFHDIV
jgi:hypothetical protein